MLTRLRARVQSWLALDSEQTGSPAVQASTAEGFISAHRQKIFYALAAGNLVMLPFAFNHFWQGRPLLGVATTAMTVCFAVNAVAVYRAKAPPLPFVFVLLPALTALAFSMFVQGMVGILWSYPAMLLFHFVLVRRVANLVNACIVLMAGPLVYRHLGGPTTARVVATMVLTIVFTNIFSRINESQQRSLGAQIALSANQVKFIGDMLEALPISIALRDTEGRFRQVNRTWERYFNIRREDAYGKRIAELPGWKDNPELRLVVERAEALDRQAIERGADSPSEPIERQRLGRTYLHSQRAFVDTAGQPVGVVAVSLDTTEQHAMAAALAMEERRLDLVVRAARVGIVDWDGRTHATFYSPLFREILGHPPDADTSTWPDYFKVLVHPDDRERVTMRWRAFITGKGPEGPRGEYYSPEEYRLLRADGSYVWVQVSGICVRDEKGFVTRWIAGVTDISGRHAQEEALRQNVRLREEVERISRHDLKTPLNSVIAVSRLLRENSRLAAEDDELLSTLERAGYRILNMVNMSLDLFRMEQGTYPFSPRAVDLVDVARKAAADLEGQASSKNVSVRLRQLGGYVEPGAASPTSLLARGEELLCYSMLANILKNAIEASPENATVTITLEGAGDRVRLHVHNGGAVPESMRANFFKKYATAGKSTGLGLGTYSAQLMAHVQGGDISLETSDAEGTTVTVMLAAATSEDVVPTGTATSRARAEAERLPQLPPLHVLVADDDEFNRLVMRRMLPSPPLTLDLTVNGRAAIDAALSQWPDVVLLDLEMPVMDGYEAAARLREMETTEGRRRCKIVAISSNDDRATMDRAIRAGCDQYLVKPAPREMLWRILAGDPVTASPAEGGPAHVDPGVPILVDPDLLESVPAFLESRRQMLDEIEPVLERGDRASFKRLAHKLAGGFSLYGFAWAAAACRALEKDAAHGEKGALATRAAAIRTHLERAEIRPSPALGADGHDGENRSR